MIIDILLILVLFAAAFGVGWYCRGKFGTSEAMIDAGADKMKGWARKADSE